MPPAKVTLALAISEPPILVHFIPTRVRTAAKNPVMTETIARALHACRNTGRASMEGYSLQSVTPVVSETQSFQRLE